MNLAPVLIITLNRYEHLKRCIESLAKNEYAKDTELYIGIDFPPSEKYEVGYRKVLEYVRNGINGFRNVVILEQKENKGPFGNFVELQKLAYEKYDRFIYSEDDNEFSSNYLEYMNTALDIYEVQEDVLAVSGYAYPISIENMTGNVFLCDTYFSALGYGMWKKKENSMRQYLNKSYFEKLFKNRKYMKELREHSPNQYANMVKAMLGYTPDLFYKGKLREVDLAFGLYMQACKMKMVFPVISKVRNWGYDGSGVNCSSAVVIEGEKMNHRNYNFEMQELDCAARFEELTEEKNLSLEQINKKMDEYFCISNKEMFRVRIAYMLAQVLGIDYMRKKVGKKGVILIS